MTLRAVVGLAVSGVALVAAGDVEGQDEGGSRPVVHHVEVHGLDLLDPPLQLPRLLPLREGVQWTRGREEATEDAVAEALAERGHPYGLVQARSTMPRPGREVRVVVEILDPGPEARFGPVQVEAVPPLTEEMVRDRLAFSPGDVFRPSLLEATRERLLREPVVARAVVIPVGLLEGDPQVTTVVSAAPVERPRSPELHGVISSSRCLEASGYWRDRLFLDSPRTLSLGGGVSNLFARQLDNRFPCSEVGEGEHAGLDYFAEGELHGPWPGDPRTGIRTRVFFQRRSAAPVYVERAFGGSVEVTRELDPEVDVSVGYRFQRLDLRAAAAFFCVNFGACTGDDLAELAGPRRWAPLEGRARWLPRETRRARGTDPAREPRPEPGAGEEATGTLTPAGGALLVPEWRPWAEARASVGGTATGSEATYGRLTAQAGVARTVGRRGELAGRVRLGALARGEGGLLPQLFFFSGGTGSVRGIQANLLGPRILRLDAEGLRALGCAPEPGGCPDDGVTSGAEAFPRPQGGTFLAEASLEARARLAPWLQAAVFVDAGLLRSSSPGLEEAAGQGTVNAVATPGAGFRFDTPAGLIRLDVALDPRSPRRTPVLARWDEELAEGSALELGDLVPMGKVLLDPFTHDAPGPLRELARRLHVTVGVGQPF